MTDEATTRDTDQGQQAAREPPFDVAIADVLHQAHALIFARHPEARSLASVVDYFGQVNDAQVQKGVWSGTAGPVDTPDAVFGSMFQTLRLLEQQFARAIDYGARLRDTVQDLSAEALRLHEEIDRLEKAAGAKRREPDQPAVRPAGAAD